MNNRSHSRRSRRGSGVPSWLLSPHVLLLGAIILIAAAALIRLAVWNRGTRAESTTNASATAFDVEVQDLIVPLDPAKLAGREDDGVTTILFLGNDPISDETGETGIAGQIAALAAASSGSGAGSAPAGNSAASADSAAAESTAAAGDSAAAQSSVSGQGSAAEQLNISTICAGFPSSRVASVNAHYDLSAVDDVFNMYYVANAINSGDFSAMQSAAALQSDSRYAEAADTLASTDFNTVDMIVFFYDAQDYFTSSPVMNENDDNDIQTYTGAMKRAFELIQARYPHIRLVFLSPTYAEYMTGDGSVQSGDSYDIGNGALPTYWAKAIDICTGSAVSFLDNYYGSINQYNYRKFLSDNVHLNEKGRRLIADHFTRKVLLNDYSEYDVSAASAQIE